MTDEEKEFIKKINIDRAKNETKICIGLSILSLFTYIFPLIIGDFDFGIIFEALTLVFIIIARKYMAEYKDDQAKKYVIAAMIPIGWLVIYDLMTVISYYSNIVALAILGIDFFIQEAVVIINLIFIYVTLVYLKKATNPEKYKGSTDWFYERLNQKHN